MEGNEDVLGEGLRKSTGNEGRAAREARVETGRAVEVVPILGFRLLPSLSLLSEVEQKTESNARGVVAPLDLDTFRSVPGTCSEAFLRPLSTGVALEVVAE